MGSRFRKLTVSNKIEHIFTLWLSNSTVRHLPKRRERYDHTKACREMFETLAQTGDNPNVHQPMHEQRNRDNSLQWNTP